MPINTCTTARRFILPARTGNYAPFSSCSRYQRGRILTQQVDNYYFEREFGRRVATITGISIMEGKAEAEQRPWSDLPRDVLFLIFQKLGAIEVLLAAQAVCTSWRQLALEPHLWHCIDLRLKPSNLNDCLVEKLTFVAINRSDGYIEEFYAGGFIWDDTFTYIANRTIGLRSFGLISPRGFTEGGLVDFICQCPLLEQLEITDYSISAKFYRKIGRACPKLKCFRLNRWFEIREYWASEADRNEEAFEIANNLSELHELQLIGNPLSKKGLEAIVDKCLHLESLDIRDCCDVYVGAELEAKLLKIKSVKLPILYKGNESDNAIKTVSDSDYYEDRDHYPYCYEDSDYDEDQDNYVPSFYLFHDS